jgi:serine-type D-Ala-D-Ala carboxypeptidase/endopeptidase (penicillin-binding protein 4)
MKKLPLFVFALLVIPMQSEVGVFAQVNTRNLQLTLEELANDDDLVSGSFSFYATNITDDTLIASYNENKSLIPASIQKVVTTLYALKMFGENHRFKTELGYSGELLENKLIGNIVLKGYGDPALLSNHFESRYHDFFTSLIDSLKSQSIDTIQGKLIIDASYFGKYNTPVDWIWNDIGNYYGASPYSVNLYDNRFDLFFKSGASKNSPTSIVSTHPKVNVEIENRVIADQIKSDQAYVYGAPFAETIWVKGTIPTNQKNFNVKAAIPNPPQLLGQLFLEELHNIGMEVTEGIEVIYTSPQSFHTIATFLSPSLLEIAKITNKKSHNLFAEVLLLHLCKQQNFDYENDYPGKVLEQLMKKDGIDLKGANIRDGSGLSRSNLITTRQMTILLSKLYENNDLYEQFHTTLPRAGKDGSLASMFHHSAAIGRLNAKSGYLNLTRSYSGYVTSKSGKLIAFTIIANNYTCSPYQMKTKLEKVMIRLCEL